MPPIHHRAPGSSGGGDNDGTYFVDNGVAVGEPSGGSAGEVDAVGEVVGLGEGGEIVVVPVVDERVAEDEHCRHHLSLGGGAPQQQQQQPWQRRGAAGGHSCEWWGMRRCTHSERCTSGDFSSAAGGSGEGNELYKRPRRVAGAAINAHHCTSAGAVMAAIPAQSILSITQMPP